jgi:hypothetical protein
MAHWAEILDKDCKRYKRNISNRDDISKVYWEIMVSVKIWKQTVALGKIWKEKWGKKSLSSYGHMLQVDDSFPLTESETKMLHKYPAKKLLVGGCRIMEKFMRWPIVVETK